MRGFISAKFAGRGRGESVVGWTGDERWAVKED